MIQYIHIRTVKSTQYLLEADSHIVEKFFLEAEAIMVLLLFAGLFTTGGGLTVLHCLLPQILRSPFPSEGREALENIADDFKTENLRFSQLELV